MSHALVRRTIAGGASLAALASVALTVAAPAHATLPGSNGKITYSSTTATSATDANGGGLGTFLIHGADASWAPDGSRVAYVSESGVAADAGLWTALADGSAPVHLTTAGGETHPVWTPGGSRIIYSRGGTLYFASSDGGGWMDVLVNHPASTDTDVYPSVSRNSIVAFERDSQGTPPAVYSYDLRPFANPPALLLSNAADPDFSPDGTQIAFTRPDPATNLPQVWIAKADGTGATQLTTDTPYGAGRPTWSPDGKTILYIQPSRPDGSGPVERLVLGTNTPTATNVFANRVSWQPIQKNYVDRVWGQNAVGTAIAASQWNYRDNGNTADPVRSQANAVVLSRADAFYDALAGSALAINKQAPLLITYPSGLDSGVQAEIKRVLGTSGTVYLLGGTAALPAAIADKLTSLGYTVKRLAGPTAIETAIAIDKEITSGLNLTVPHTVIVATASEFYDALAAGAAAGANPGTAIVLTWGDMMPDASAKYLNALNPDWKATNGTAIVAGGGPGDRALNSAAANGQLPSWPSPFYYWPLVGQNAKDTALLLAGFFFAAPPVAAVATSAGWYDALTGGAMIGANHGPLLLTDPTGLYGPVADYLSADAGGLWDGVILGGTAALPSGLETPIGNAISLPGQWTYIDYQPTTGTPSARGLTAQAESTATGPAGKVTADQRTTGTLPGISRTAPSTLTR